MPEIENVTNSQDVECVTDCGPLDSCNPDDYCNPQDDKHKTDKNKK